MSTRHAAMKAPRAMPGMKPAANEAPENLEDEPEPGFSRVPLGGRVAAAAAAAAVLEVEGIVDVVVASEPAVLVVVVSEAAVDVELAIAATGNF